MFIVTNDIRRFLRCPLFLLFLNAVPDATPVKWSAASPMKAPAVLPFRGYG